MKRYLYIIIGIVVAAVVAILILLFIKSQSSTSTTVTGTSGTLPVTTTTQGTTATQGNTPQATSTAILTLGSSGSSTANQPTAQSFGILSTNPTLDYFVSPQNVITAIQPSGSVVTITNGTLSVINSSTLSDIISASFSADGQKILVSFGSPTNPQATVFDLKTHVWSALPTGMLSPRWSATGYQIAYLSVPSAGKLALSIINAANLKSGTATLLTLHANDMNLQWPTKTQFILSDRPTIDNNGSLLIFNSQNGTLTPIISEQPGIESVWNQVTTTVGLVFATTPSGGTSLTLETISKNISGQTLNISTLPSKCIFNSTNLYCGIPRSSSNFSSAHLPDDYNMMALFTSDDLYKIDTTNGQTQNLWSDQAQNIDTSDLKIFNGTLFFINRYNQELYGLVLTQ